MVGGVLEVLEKIDVVCYKLATSVEPDDEPFAGSDCKADVLASLQADPRSQRELFRLPRAELFGLLDAVVKCCGCRVGWLNGFYPCACDGAVFQIPLPECLNMLEVEFLGVAGGVDWWIAVLGCVHWITLRTWL